MWMASRWVRWLPGVLLLLPWLVAPTVPSRDDRLRDLAGPYAFRLLDWETVQLMRRADRLWAGVLGSRTAAPDDGETLQAYFQAGPRSPAQRAAAEAALERLVGQAYISDGLSRSQPLPVDRLFPPVLVALTPPPNVLVISPRTELRVLDSSILQGMDVAAQEQLEAAADSTDVSSLVAPIGGLATYPSMVLAEGSPDGALAAVAHEWLHQYLIFYPLGAGYWNSQETREINETTAEMVGQEVGRQIGDGLGLVGPPAAGEPAPAPSGFDFRAFMRETRRQTEQLLVAGQVDLAESYMRSRRDELQQHGYRIRKLNQAYFALYGSYGEGAAASPTSPIAGVLRQLRQQSPSLGDFIFRVRELTTVAELQAAVRAS